MALLTALTLLCFLQDPPPRPLRITPRGQEPARAQPVRDELADFRRVLRDLSGPTQKVERTLRQLAEDHGDIPALIVQTARKAGTRELGDLMVAARRFGTPEVADELLFQLLSRPLGAATGEVLDVMVVLKGDQGRDALRQCIRGQIAGVRRHATTMLCRGATAADETFALEIAGAGSLDMQLSGLELLAAVPTDAARRQLVLALTRDATVAGAACRWLIAVGKPAVPMLVEVLQQPAVDRSYDYAAFALCAIDELASLPAAAVPVLCERLQARDALGRTLAAIVLAELSFRGQGGGDAALDRAVVAALLDVVEPQGFVANLDLVRPIAQQRLQRLSGRIVGKDALTWREWWGSAGETFVGVRTAVAIDENNAGRAAIDLRTPAKHVRVLGEQLADVPPMAGAQEIVLPQAALLALVRRLEAEGFTAQQLAAAPGLPLSRSLQIQLPETRAQVTAPDGHAGFTRLAALIDAEVDAELWQLYRDPAAERGAYWRAEQAWRQANPDQLARDQRFLRAVVKCWLQIGEGQRALAMGRILASPHRRQLVGEQDAADLIELARHPQVVGENQLLMLELAVTAPGDAWRDAVQLAWSMPGGGRIAVGRLFAVLGSEHVLTALADERQAVRLAAIDEVVRSRDLRAAPTLVRLIGDADLEVNSAAIGAAGVLALSDARGLLLAMIASPETKPELRHEAMRSLGRIGGEGVYPMLERQLMSGDAADRLAALRGIGELRETRAAVLLCDLFVADHAGEVGQTARFHLMRMGASLAVPALKMRLRVQNPDARREVVLLLAGYQDPSVVPDLVDLLRLDQDALRAATLLEGVTGLEVASLNDRVGVVEVWWRQNRDLPQWRWLLGSLERAKVTHTLAAAQFEGNAGLEPVPELARLLVEAPLARQRQLVSAVLRNLTGEDFGVVMADSSRELLEAMAARYRTIYETMRAAGK